MSPYVVLGSTLGTCLVCHIGCTCRGACSPHHKGTSMVSFEFWQQQLVIRSWPRTNSSQPERRSQSSRPTSPEFLTFVDSRTAGHQGQQNPSACDMARVASMGGDISSQPNPQRRRQSQFLHDATGSVSMHRGDRLIQALVCRHV